MFAVSKKIVTLLLSLFIFVNVKADVESNCLVKQQNLYGSFDDQNDIGDISPQRFPPGRSYNNY